MTKFAWVTLGMLTAGIGGAVATGASMSVFKDLEPQPDVVVGSLTALGGVFAGLCGGIASLGRGHERDRIEFLTGLAPLAFGVVGAGFINPGLLFCPFILVIAPLQGLAALLGGFATVGILWAILWMAGVRDRIHPLPVDVGPADPGTYNPIALLKKLGCGSVLLGCVLPLLAFFGNSPVISWISLAAVSVGVLVCAGAFFADVSETLSNQAMQRVRNTIGPDEESNVKSR